MANRYVREAAAGANNGTDWTNAYTDIPATLTRGDTYYFADGSYASAGYDFDDAESGTTRITLRKATVADHGTSTGWSDAYGDGQAAFNAPLVWYRGYYTMTGVTRNESDWFDSTAYGFVVNHNGAEKNLVTGRGASRSDSIELYYIYVSAKVGGFPGTTVGRNAIDSSTGDTYVLTGHIYSKLFVNGACNVWFLQDTDGAIVEYCASTNADGNAQNHGEVVNLYYCDRTIVRYNIFKDEYLVGGSTAIVALTFSTGHRIYGNLFYRFKSGDGSIGFDGSTATDTLVYNNTIADPDAAGGGSSAIRLGASGSCFAYNNLFINCESSLVFSGVTHDYNGFTGTNAFTESNAQINLTTSLFTNYAGDNFHLASATNSGTTLSSPYNTDMDGVTRGGDGAWDRGALEYVGGGPPPQTFIMCQGGV